VGLGRIGAVGKALKKPSDGDGHSEAVAAVLFISCEATKCAIDT